MERINSAVLYYQQIIGAHDKQLWERSVEEAVLKSLQNVTRKSAKVNPDLIDVDLVRGSTFSKSKPQHGWVAVSVRAAIRLIFLPFYYKWWLKSATRWMFVLLTLLYVLQIVTLVVYFTDAETIINTELLSLTHLLSPVIMMYALSLIHTQIMATHSSGSRSMREKPKRESISVSAVINQPTSHSSYTDTEGVNEAEEYSSDINQPSVSGLHKTLQDLPSERRPLRSRTSSFTRNLRRESASGVARSARFSNESLPSKQSKVKKERSLKKTSEWVNRLSPARDSDRRALSDGDFVYMSDKTGDQCKLSVKYSEASNRRLSSQGISVHFEDDVHNDVLSAGAMGRTSNLSDKVNDMLSNKCFFSDSTEMESSMLSDKSKNFEELVDDNVKQEDLERGISEGQDLCREGHDICEGLNFTEGQCISSEGHDLLSEGHDLLSEGHDLCSESLTVERDRCDEWCERCRVVGCDCAQALKRNAEELDECPPTATVSRANSCSSLSSIASSVGADTDQHISVNTDNSVLSVTNDNVSLTNTEVSADNSAGEEFYNDANGRAGEIVGVSKCNTTNNMEGVASNLGHDAIESVEGDVDSCDVDNMVDNDDIQNSYYDEVARSTGDVKTSENIQQDMGTISGIHKLISKAADENISGNLCAPLIQCEQRMVENVNTKIRLQERLSVRWIDDAADPKVKLSEDSGVYLSDYCLRSISSGSSTVFSDTTCCKDEKRNISSNNRSDQSDAVSSLVEKCANLKLCDSRNIRNAPGTSHSCSATDICESLESKSAERLDYSNTVGDMNIDQSLGLRFRKVSQQRNVNDDSNVKCNSFNRSVSNSQTLRCAPVQAQRNDQQLAEGLELYHKTSSIRSDKQHRSDSIELNESLHPASEMQDDIRGEKFKAAELYSNSGDVELQGGVQVFCPNKPTPILQDPNSHRGSVDRHCCKLGHVCQDNVNNLIRVVGDKPCCKLGHGGQDDGTNSVAIIHPLKRATNPSGARSGRKNLAESTGLSSCDSEREAVRVRRARSKTASSEWEDTTFNTDMTSCSVTSTGGTSASEISENETGRGSTGISQPVNSGNSQTIAPVMKNLGSTNDKVSCVIWENNEVQKVDLTVLDIGCGIIEKVQKLHESCDYLLVGALFSIVLMSLPIVYRLYHNKDDLDLALSQTSNWNRIVLLAQLAFGQSWRQAFIVLNGVIQRLCLSLVIFFLLSVAERTFKQRLLYAKNFCYLTSSRRAKKYDLPHFRLNKVRNIKTWLSLRSFLKRRGPQRSVESIVSAAFLSVIVLISVISMELLQDYDSFLEHLGNWELTIWCLFLGVYLMRFFTLGTKINKKYRNFSVLITEQINLYLHMEQKPHKKDELMLANSVLKLAEDLLKELESPFKVSGLVANPFLYNITKVVVLSAFSAVLTELLGFKLKLSKIKIRA